MDEIHSLQAQFERFAGFKFDRANSLEAALEARRKIFLEAEMELAKRNAEDAKKRQEAARAVVEERRRNEQSAKQARAQEQQRAEQERLVRLAARQQRQALELRARKVESLRSNLRAIRSSRAEIAAVAAESQHRTAHVAAYTARVSVARHALLQHTTPADGQRAVRGVAPPGRPPRPQRLFPLQQRALVPNAPPDGGAERVRCLRAVHITAQSAADQRAAFFPVSSGGTGRR